MIIIIVYEEKDNDGKRKVAPGLKESPAGLLVARNFVNHRVRHFFQDLKSPTHTIIKPCHDTMKVSEKSSERNQQSIVAVI